MSYFLLFFLLLLFKHDYNYISDIKRSVAERKEQITRKLSCSKVPSSKQKKELREEIIEIKTQIKPDIKKFQDIEQQVILKFHSKNMQTTYKSNILFLTKKKLLQVKAESRLEHSRTKASAEAVEVEDVKDLQKEQAVKEKKEEIKQEQFRKFDPSSPAKPTPKHLQRHMRNESMRFPSGDFSNVTITPKKSTLVETHQTTETKQTTEIKIDTFTKEAISQKEKDSARVEEKLDDGDRSPDLINDENKDIAEATLKDKINAFETKISKEPTEASKQIKLTKEALKRHTQEQEQSLEYTQAFVREQSKQVTNIESQKIVTESEKQIESVKSVKETVQQFDSKVKHEEKPKQFPKTMRTDSTLVQVSSEEDSEFLKKSTDSETETESQTTIKVEKDKISKFDITKHTFERKIDIKDQFDTRSKPDDKDKQKKADDVKKTIEIVPIVEQVIGKPIKDELSMKISDEQMTKTVEEKEIPFDDKFKEKVTLLQYY